MIFLDKTRICMVISCMFLDRPHPASRSFRLGTPLFQPFAVFSEFGAQAFRHAGIERVVSSHLRTLSTLLLPKSPATLLESAGCAMLENQRRDVTLFRCERPDTSTGRTFRGKSFVCRIYAKCTRKSFRCRIYEKPPGVGVPPRQVSEGVL